MRTLRALFYRCKGLIGLGPNAADLDAELKSHIEMHYEDNLRSGMPPKEARRQAFLHLGGLESTRQAYWERTTIPFIETILQDLSFAVRQFARSPGFTWTAIGVFALGVAACLAVFAFVDSALVKPLPYQDPARLVAVFESAPIGPRYHISYDDFADFRRQNRVFSSIDMFEPDRFTLKRDTDLEQVPGARVSDGFFRTLGVTPILGRDFVQGEDQPSSPRTVLLSYITWQRRFGGSPSIVGQKITLDGTPSIVVGVLPSSFHFAPVEPAEFWATLHGDCTPGMGRICHRYYGVARLQDGTDLKDASANLSTIATQIAHAFPKSNRDRGVTILPLSQLVLGDVRPVLIALLAGSLLLLSIGLVNVSGLLLLRAETRKRETALRGALGASSGRLIRQFVVEGLLLAFVGTGFGACCGLCAVASLSRLVPTTLRASMPFLQATYISPHLMIAAGLILLIGGTVFSAVPSLRLFTSNMQRDLAEGGRSAARSSWRKVGSSLVMIELAVAMVLLIGASLLGKSFYRLTHVDLGITTDNLALLHVADMADKTEAQQIQLERTVLSRLSTIPGMSSVGISFRLAVGNGDGFAHYRVAGRAYPGEGDEANDRMASTGYFETLHAHLLRGRYFTENDGVKKPHVVVVNQTLARQFFPGEDPLGKHIVREYNPDELLEIIGVIADVKEGALDSEPTPAVYASFEQQPESDFFVTARSIQPARQLIPSMVAAIRSVSPEIIADQGDTMSERIGESQTASLHRSAAWIVSGFALLALVLGCIGLYGVISYSVSQRTREIGVRIALGCPRTSIYQLVLNEAGTLALFGITLGLVCSLLTTRLLRSMLFGVSPWDAASITSVAATLVAAALLASYLPARRAALMNPVEALRAD